MAVTTYEESATNSPSVYSQYVRPSSHRYKNAKKGLPFNVMLVGPSGLGRRTFLNTLCERAIVIPDDGENAETTKLPEAMKIQHYTVDIEEDGMRILLNVIDTPGFGDSIDNSDNFKEIQDYLEYQFDEVLEEENRIKRNPKFRDGRVHALLYFITPTGHSLREIDIELMRRLGSRVNVIPIIGRADSMTVDELKKFKKRIMQDIDFYRIPVYMFPTVDDDDEETIEENNELRASLPFAVVGCEEVVEKDNRPVRARLYPWGAVEVDNEEHSDFDRLRYVLLNSHIGDLREITQNMLYENYRTEKLSLEDNDDEDKETSSQASSN
ncbi:Septin-like protein [Zancudomyces culisetae]|uniref:Septin-like protein n=1 Tax=Zancudomyces culisetae TaxID=1213189 RepID=A0A1R1PL80_ZANCU|nr:Septin-like protein [Zancudomyces culisetae]|eukprot:OMH81683.1 Septin-like protein [Zancudomyces culisetae]